MSLSLFIARRIYRESDGGKQVSRPAVLIAMAGIAIGLAVMIIAVAVVIGFKSEVRNKVIGFGSHIQITNLDAVSSYETHPIVVGDSMMTALADYPEISHVQRFSTKPGMIKTDDAFQGMVLKGVGPEFDPHFIKEYLVEGEIPVFSDSVSTNQVLISKALATKMKLKLGDKIYTYYIQDDIRARRLTIAGIYQTNFSEYDNLFLLTDLNLVNRLNGWQPEQVTGVELQVKDYDRLEDITYEIATDTCERTNMIGILKALGANNFTIRRTFLWFAVFLIGKGMFWGNAIGLAFCILQSQFGFFKLDPATYYVDTVPVSFNVLLFILINLGTLCASVLMLIGPSFLITKINPASSMRYE